MQQAAPGVKQGAASETFDTASGFADASPMTENDDEGLRARGEKLGDALKAAQSALQAEARPATRKPNVTGAALSLGLRASSEIVAGVVVGGVIGWGLDRLFHTKPAFLILFLLLGCAAGIVNVIRETAPKSPT